jgi:hypothetical protein
MHPHPVSDVQPLVPPRGHRFFLVAKELEEVMDAVEIGDQYTAIISDGEGKRVDAPAYPQFQLEFA